MAQPWPLPHEAEHSMHPQYGSAGPFPVLSCPILSCLKGLCCSLPPAGRLRIYHYYLPVYFWVQHQLEGHRKEAGSQPATPLMVSSCYAAAGGEGSCWLHVFQQMQADSSTPDACCCSSGRTRHWAHPGYAIP
jgi:hypothetical protein